MNVRGSITWRRTRRSFRGLRSCSAPVLSGRSFVTLRRGRRERAARPPIPEVIRGWPDQLRQLIPVRRFATRSVNPRPSRIRSDRPCALAARLIAPLLRLPIPAILNSGAPLCRLCGAGAKSRHRSERFADRHHRLRTGLARAADQFGEQVSASAAPSQEADRRQVLAQKLRFTWIESTNPERLDRLPQGNHRAFRVEPIRAFQGARIGPASTSGVDSRAQVL